MIGDRVCEIADERGRSYRSERNNGYQRQWIECRIPDSMPAGNYNISFEHIYYGNSITAAAGYAVSWSNASSGHSITVLPESDKASKIVVDNIYTIKNTNKLLVKGENLNKSGVKVEWGGRE